MSLSEDEMNDLVEMLEGDADVQQALESAVPVIVTTTSITPHQDGPPTDSINDGDPTNEELLRIFTKKRQSDEDYKPPVSDLIELLGGIDSVMNVMLTSSDLNMTFDNRMTMLKHFESSDHHNIVETLDIADVEEAGKQLAWTEKVSDNVFVEIAPLLSSWLYSRYAVGTLTVFTLIPLVINSIVPVIVPHLDDSKTYMTFGHLSYVVSWWYVCITVMCCTQELKLSEI